MPYNNDLFVLDHIDFDFYINQGNDDCFPTKEQRQGYFSVTDTAMIASLKSRSANGVMTDLIKVREKGSSFFIEQFYKKYGHGSIGQNSGIVGVYAEKVSMLAAKAIQDDNYYNGQESSSRYLDFTKMDVVIPTDVSDDQKAFMSGWNKRTMETYAWALAETIIWLKETINPELIAGKSEKEIESTVRARAFDICRGILPAGVQTYVAWHGLLETLNRRLPELIGDTLSEVADLGVRLNALLVDKYPESFDMVNTDQIEAVRYKHRVSKHLTDCTKEDNVDFSKLDTEALPLLTILSRKRRQSLPKNFKLFGTIHWDMCIDFGSWRDIQRHREIYTSRPVLTVDHGFEYWYTDNMPEHVANVVRQHMLELRSAVWEKVNMNSLYSKETIQYMVPMCFKVRAVQVVTLPQFVYICELRSGETVHPTVRNAVIKAWGAFEQHVHSVYNMFDSELAKTILERIEQNFFVNKKPSVMSIRRGGQDIEGIRD